MAESSAAPIVVEDLS